MKRHRDVAAAPVRSPAEAWSAITGLVVATLYRSAVSQSDVTTAMSAATPAGLALIAGGHLDRQPLTLISGSVYCTIGTVSGTSAFGVDENLEAIPGAALATGFIVHLPCPHPHVDFVRSVAEASPHLSAAEPSEPVAEAAARGRGIIDLAALERLRATDV